MSKDVDGFVVTLPNLPFDGKRMFRGGFEELLRL